MSFQLPDLPYSRDALSPYISAETLDYHHGKHHAAYVKKLNTLITDTEFADQSLEDIIRQSSGGIFNNAAQHWNHSFYWQCLAPHAPGKPAGTLAEQINERFGSFDEFVNQFNTAATGQFGSGWAWLVKDASGQLDIQTTGNADNPLVHEATPLLTCDVWEHAYYIDTRNDRGAYLKNFWPLVNWDFVSNNLSNSQ